MHPKVPQASARTIMIVIAQSVNVRGRPLSAVPTTKIGLLAIAWSCTSKQKNGEEHLL